MWFPQCCSDSHKAANMFSPYTLLAGTGLESSCYLYLLCRFRRCHLKDRHYSIVLYNKQETQRKNYNSIIQWLKYCRHGLKRLSTNQLTPILFQGWSTRSFHHHCPIALLPLYHWVIAVYLNPDVTPSSSQYIAPPISP